MSNSTPEAKIQKPCQHCAAPLPASDYIHQCPVVMASNRERYEKIANNPLADQKSVQDAYRKYELSNTIGGAGQ